MSFIELKLLILAQIGIDVIIVAFFVFLIKKLKYSNNKHPLEKPMEVFESLLTEADKTADQFKEQLEEKHHLINKLNEQLDKRIISLNVLLNRADVLLSSQGNKAVEAEGKPISLDHPQTDIIQLAQKGHGVDKIADLLSIPKEEVKLVLDLKKKFSQMGSQKSVS